MTVFVSSIRSALLAALFLVMGSYVGGWGVIRAQRDASTEFRPPRFVNLLTPKLHDQLLTGGVEANRACAVRLDYERLKNAAESAMAAASAARSAYPADARGSALFDASEIAIRARTASEDFLRMEQAWQECSRRETPAVTWRIGIYAEPSAASRMLGTIGGRGDGRGVTFSFRALNGPAAVNFELDDSDGDTFYGHFQHTVLAARGDWLLLPRRPFPVPAWVNLRRDLDEPPVAEDPHVFYFDKPTPAMAWPGNRQVSLPAGSQSRFVIVGTKNAQVLIREEVDSERCNPDVSESQRTAELATAAQFLVDADNFVDEDRHAIFRNAYPRGC